MKTPASLRISSLTCAVTAWSIQHGLTIASVVLRQTVAAVHCSGVENGHRFLPQHRIQIHMAKVPSAFTPKSNFDEESHGILENKKHSIYKF